MLLEMIWTARATAPNTLRNVHLKAILAVMKLTPVVARHPLSAPRRLGRVEIRTNLQQIWKHLQMRLETHLVRMGRTGGHMRASIVANISLRNKEDKTEK